MQRSWSGRSATGEMFSRSIFLYFIDYGEPVEYRHRKKIYRVKRAFLEIDAPINPNNSSHRPIADLLIGAGVFLVLEDPELRHTTAGAICSF